MKYKCFDCGNEFDDPVSFEEYRGEFWGEPAYEWLSGCPVCRGDYEEIEEESEDEETDYE